MYMRSRTGAVRPRRCGATLFVRTGFGPSNVTTLSSVGMLRLARFLVVGTPMMTSFNRATKSTPGPNEINEISILDDGKGHIYIWCFSLRFSCHVWSCKILLIQ
ncbi:hypothetical protein CsatB_022534 [Cannabis sativa]